MSDIADNDRFVPREDLVLEEIEDEVVVLDLKSNSYFGLNPVGRLVWRGLENDQNVGQVVDAIAEQFDVERDQVAQDVRGFIEEALSAGLFARP